MTEPTAPASAYLDALQRHFADLRDGTHGPSDDSAATREDKEKHFRRSAELLAPYAFRVLDELNAAMLLGTGTIAASGPQRTADSGLTSAWTLSWPEQRQAGIAPITLVAHYGWTFHHPHLRGATVAEWPLNVFTDEQAAAELPTLRAIATADLHNLVFQRDFRIVPAIVRGEVATGSTT